MSGRNGGGGQGSGQARRDGVPDGFSDQQPSAFPITNQEWLSKRNPKGQFFLILHQELKYWIWFHLIYFLYIFYLCFKLSFHHHHRHRSCSKIFIFIFGACKSNNRSFSIFTSLFSSLFPLPFYFYNLFRFFFVLFVCSIPW